MYITKEKEKNRCNYIKCANPEREGVTLHNNRTPKSFIYMEDGECMHIECYIQAVIEKICETKDQEQN